MKHAFGPIQQYEKHHAIPLLDAAEVYKKLSMDSPSFLFESRSINPLYGRMSLLGVDPILEIKGQDDEVIIQLTTPSNSSCRAASLGTGSSPEGEQTARGQKFFDAFLESGVLEKADAVVEKSNKKIVLKITKEDGFLPENIRSRRKNTAQILRAFLEFFEIQTPSNSPLAGGELFGLFGGFSYDFARLFEELPEELEKKDIPEFRFFLFDTFVKFDLIKERAEIICYRETEEEGEKAVKNYELRITNERDERGNKKNVGVSHRHAQSERKIIIKNIGEFSTKNITCDVEKEEYMQQVEIAKDLAKRGETFEVVFSREFSGDFSGDPFAIYEIYREKNPAPYLFFFDFGEKEYLVGASPEMMVRVENRKAHLRPISGTRPRGNDPVSDHENELELLSCEKERAELDMLIDLGRNDLKRVCKNGIHMTAYRHVEKYSRVMHTIAHLTGELQDDATALDAIIACQSAGTLTGAPKVQAMKEIEHVEKSRRGYYGGSVGYLGLNGDMDTGIIIRSTHIKNEKFSFRVGSTLLYDSEPEDEYKETENKARALLDILKG